MNNYFEAQTQKTKEKIAWVISFLIFVLVLTLSLSVFANNHGYQLAGSSHNHDHSSHHHSHAGHSHGHNHDHGHEHSSADQSSLYIKDFKIERNTITFRIVNPITGRTIANLSFNL